MHAQVVESCKVGVRKPKPEIFNHCLNRLHVLPDEAIFLEDFDQNLAAAERMGIRTIKVNISLQSRFHKNTCHTRV